MVIRRRNTLLLLGGSLLVTAAWLGAESARNAPSGSAGGDASAAVWKGFIPDMTSAKIVQDAGKRSGTEQPTVAAAVSTTGVLPKDPQEEAAVEVATDQLLPEPMPVTMANDTMEPAPEIPSDVEPDTVEPEIKMSLAPLPTVEKKQVAKAAVSPAEPKEKSKETAPVSQHVTANASGGSEAAELVSAILPRTVETKETEKKPEVAKKPATDAKKAEKKEKTVASTSARKILEELPVKSVTTSEAAPEPGESAPVTKDYAEEKKSSDVKSPPRTEKVVASKTEPVSVAKKSQRPNTSGRQLKKNELSVVASDSNLSGEAPRSDSDSSDNVSGIVVSLSRSNGVLRMLVSSPDRGVVQVVGSQAEFGTLPAPGSEVSVSGRRISGNGSRNVIQAESIQRKSGTAMRNASTATVLPRPVIHPGGPVMGPGMPPMMGGPVPGMMMPGPMGPFGGPPPFPMM